MKIVAHGKQYFTNESDTETYKQVPRGYAKDHPRAELLKMKGVTLGQTTPVPEVLHTEGALDYVFERFERMFPLHRWLKEMKTTYCEN